MLRFALGVTQLAWWRVSGSCQEAVPAGTRRDPDVAVCQNMTNLWVVTHLCCGSSWPTDRRGFMLLHWQYVFVLSKLKAFSRSIQSLVWWVSAVFEKLFIQSPWLTHTVSVYGFLPASLCHFLSACVFRQPAASNSLTGYQNLSCIAFSNWQNLTF